MKRTTATAMLAAIALAGSVCVVGAAGRESSANVLIAKKEKALEKINVSKYPDDMKSKYKLFTKKCGTCHALSVAINTDYVTQEEWEPVLNDMIAVSGTLINADEAKQLLDFVVYDSQVRKKSARTVDAAKPTDSADSRVAEAVK